MNRFEKIARYIYSKEQQIENSLLTVLVIIIVLILINLTF